MSQPQPFPIADFTEGLDLGKEPWLSPRNAFRKMENARSYLGQLQNREGFTRFAELAEQSADQSGNYGNYAGFSSLEAITSSIGLVDEWVIPESVLISAPRGAANAVIECEVNLDSGNFYSDFQAEAPASRYAYITPGNVTNAWHYDVVAAGTNTVVGAFFLQHNNAASQPVYIRVDWAQHPDIRDPVLDGSGTMNGVSTLVWRSNADEDVVGLTRFKNNDGDFSLAMDSNRVYLYDASAKYYKPQGKGASYNSYFTGGDSDYFWTWPGDDFLLMTNGIDPVHTWDPGAATDSSVAEIATAWGGGGNELDTCLLVIRFRGRTLYFRTTESSTVYPTRVRWTDAGSYTSIDALGFADAPASLGDIVTGGLIGNRIFIGFEEGWMELVATGDAVAPFSWEPVVSRFGAVSKLSTIQDNERLLSRADDSMQAIDPNGQLYLDEEIPDLILEFDPDKKELSAGVRNEQQRAFWWTYVSGQETEPKDALVATYDKTGGLAWSQYSNWAFNVFADFKSDQTPTWDSLGPLTWDDFSNVTWDDVRVGATSFTQLLGGGERGRVYKFGISATDNLFFTGRTNVPMLCETQRLSPYPGQRASLAWFDVYADAVADASIILTFYVDSKNAAYKTVTVDLSPDNGNSKIWKRVPIGKSGSFHRFRIENTSGRNVSIDALVPYFRPAGRVRPFG